MSKNNKRYRPNVAIVVVNKEGLVLACRRSDQYKIWQFPQGGIEKDETEEEAMWRELKEELGTTDAKLIGRLPDTICYDWPEHLHRKGFCGQEQSYFLVRLKKKAVINLEAHDPPEFDKAEWVSSATFLERIEGFKAKAYRKALLELIDLFPEYFSSKI